MYRGKSLQQGTISAECCPIRVVWTHSAVTLYCTLVHLNNNAHTNSILLRVISFEYRVSP